MISPEEEEKQTGNFFTDSIDDLIDKPGGEESKTVSINRQ